MADYWDRMQGIEGALRAPNPLTMGFGQQGSLRGADDAVREALKQALIRRGNENLQGIVSDQTARTNVPGMAVALSKAGSDPRTARILQERGIIQPGEQERYAAIQRRIQQLMQSQGPQGTMQALGTGGLRVQSGEAQAGLDKVRSPAMRKRLTDVLGGEDPGISKDLWTRIRSMGHYDYR